MTTVTRRVSDPGVAGGGAEARFARPHQRAWRTLAPVWATSDEQALSPAQVERLRPHDLHADRNTDAEYAFNWLPSRFQRYAEQYLFADERILAFVPWSAAATESWRQRLGRWITPGGRAACAGMVILTDRQLFLLRDAAEVTEGSAAWGYRVQATTPERLADVQVVTDPHGRPELRLALMSAAGVEDVRWTFPPASQQDVAQIGSLLQGFLPRWDDRRLRRVGRILPLERLLLPPTAVHRRPSHDPALVSADEQRALEAALPGFLASHADPTGRRRLVHATAAIPCQSGCELLAVTQAELIRVSLDDPSAVASWALSNVTSVELHASVFGWQVAWTIPSGHEEEHVSVVVPFPIVAAEACFAIFAALRQALTFLPAEAAGPEVSHETE